VESLKKFVKDESGLELVEYAVLAGLLIVSLIAMFPGLRDALFTLYNRLTSEINTLAGQ